MIVFLDFDGVCHRFFPSGSGNDGYFAFAPLIEQTLLQSGQTIQIVISSDWRKRRSVKELRALIAEHAPALAALVIDKTPHIPVSELRIAGSRLTEIQAWLNQHAPGQPWLALDDSGELFCRRKRGSRDFFAIDRLILCNDGFYEDEANRLSQKLQAIADGKPLSIHDNMLCLECGDALGASTINPNSNWSEAHFCPICGGFNELTHASNFGGVFLPTADEE